MAMAPTELVRTFLSAMEARDLERARALLAPGFTMEFPGAVRMHTLEELVAWARPRYRFARKTYTGFDCCAGPDEAVVYCFGTLHGEWLDGAAFSDIRFVDRFTIRDGLLVNQTVWNDMAEFRAAAPPAGGPTG